MTVSFDDLDLLASERNQPGIRDVQVLFHVGPHKTGTTWLQKRFFPTLDNIVYSHDFKLTHGAFLIPRYGEFSVEAVAKAFAPLLRKARKSGKPLILSDEALGGRAFGQKYYREVAAYRIKRAFPTAKVLVVSRRQDQILSSLYSEYLRYGNSSTLAAFLDQDTGDSNIHPIIDMGYYEWDKTLRFYQNLFGAEAVSMLPMEKIVENGTYITEALGRLLGIPLTSPDYDQLQRRERPSLSGWAMTALRLWNHFVPHDSRHRSTLHRFSPNSIAWKIDRITPESARKRMALSQNAMIRAQLGNRFVASNRSYAALTGMDLESLGYHLEPS